jgi:hypothetical protein
VNSNRLNDVIKRNLVRKNNQKLVYALKLICLHYLVSNTSGSSIILNTYIMVQHPAIEPEEQYRSSKIEQRAVPPKRDVT